MFELAGKTIGLIGCGDIGLAVGRIAAAFGMRVLAYRRHPDLPPERTSALLLSTRSMRNLISSVCTVR